MLLVPGPEVVVVLLVPDPEVVVVVLELLEELHTMMATDDGTLTCVPPVGFCVTTVPF